MNNKHRFNALASKIQKRYPKVKIRYKDGHWFWKRLPGSLSTNGTALGNTIWLNKKTSYNLRRLAHEYQHIVDMKSMGLVGFMSMYLHPQLLSVFWFITAIMAIFFGLKLFTIILAGVGLLLLLPWPSRSRAYLEMNGYLMSMYVASRQNKDMLSYGDFVVDTMRSWLYYKMVWTKVRSRNLVQDAFDVLEDEEAIINTSVAFRDVNEIFTKQTIV